MRWLIGLVVGGLLGLGCGKTVYRSHEGHYCSSTEQDDPFFECSPSYDLVCINTYAQQVQSTGGEPPRFQEIFLCRLACSPGDRCPDAKDVCCRGPIYGRDYGKTHACVPAGQCQTAEPTADAGPKADRTPDTSSPSPDGPESPDAGPDAGVESDANS
jgi:hypothetical protein